MHYTHFYGKRFNTAFDYIGKMIRNVTNCLYVQLSQIFSSFIAPPFLWRGAAQLKGDKVQATGTTSRESNKYLIAPAHSQRVLPCPGTMGRKRTKIDFQLALLKHDDTKGITINNTKMGSRKRLDSFWGGSDDDGIDSIFACIRLVFYSQQVGR